MLRTLSKKIFYTGAFLSCALLALNTGCASGGFKLTRQYARWVNSQNIILRIVLYILTSVVFAVTMLIDAVVFNTMDFWEGKVSQGDYHFQNQDKTYFVRHEIMPGTGLKKSTIQIRNDKNVLLQTVALNETASGQIEMYVDGVLRTKVNNITSIPMASIFDAQGKLVEEKALFFTTPDMTIQNVAQH